MGNYLVKTIYLTLVVVLLGCASVGRECCTKSAVNSTDPRVGLLQQVAAELKSADLDQEFLGIPVVESNLNPSARGRDGSVGLWQFQPRTARAYGLRVSKNVDDRLCPRKSTKAAVKYLRHLKSKFRSVELTIAAYQLGEGRLSRILSKTKQLPEHSKRYVRKVLDSHKLALALLNQQSTFSTLSG